MKKSNGLLLTVCLLAYSCGTGSGESFGSKIADQKGLMVSEALSGFDSIPSRTCAVEGKVTDVCQAEGCWFRIQGADGKELMVRMRDHSFAVPKDIAGMTVLVAGELLHDTTSVDQLKEFAKEDGKSENDIAQIIAPQVEDVLFAEGVLVR